MKEETVPERKHERDQRHAPEKTGMRIPADTQSGNHHQHQRQDTDVDAGLPEGPVRPGTPVGAPGGTGGPEKLRDEQRQKLEPCKGPLGRLFIRDLGPLRECGELGRGEELDCCQGQAQAHDHGGLGGKHVRRPGKKSSPPVGAKEKKQEICEEERVKIE